MNKTSEKLPSDMTPLELAIWHIRDEVLRGDSIEDIMACHGGKGGPGYDVSTGGHMFSPAQHEMFGNVEATEEGLASIGDPIRKIPNIWIVVHEAQGKYVNKIFRLTELFRIVKKESIQQTLFV